ncbi:MAG TPA: NAD(P)H-dependent glycerol-3-phosphate dehydrogenase [Bacteroidia bacterium]|nr:NAD(P)H-dependent glycerol-3-phosphate dehydrogenase [Bacteroidia bacterium]
MQSGNKVAVIGGGSWATAIVKILSNNCDQISWWLRSDDAVNFILKHKHNPAYLTDVEIDVTKVRPSTSLHDVVSDASLVILAVPSAFLKSVLKDTDEKLFKDKIIFSAIKGIVPDDLLIVGEFIHRRLNVPIRQIGVLTGPCHAEEVALEKLSYLTVACQETSHAALLSGLLNCRYIRATVSDDIYGTEYSAVIKNIIAIASGICNGLGYGDNFQAVLISNSIQEIKRFLDAVSPITRDINDSAYLGDLLVTAYSQFSRNRTFGAMIGKGYSVKSAQLEMNMIAEGYYAVKCIYELNKKYNVDLPVCNAVYKILYEHISPRTEMKQLSDRMK